MGIVKLQPDSLPLSKTSLPEEITAPHDSIFTALVPESKVVSLLKYVEGYPWTTVYYGQILNTNNTIENFDPSTPNLTQPYYKVHGLILQVSSPLSSSYDQATGTTSITGTAITPYKITPNVGDVFIAEVDTGEDAVFIINTVTRKTHRKDTLYEISYSLYSYTSVLPEFTSTLEQRVTDSYYFNQDTDFFNRDVLIKPSIKEATDRLVQFQRESQVYYLNTFCQRSEGAILIPGTTELISDPHLVNFMSKIVDYSLLNSTRFYRFTYFDKYVDQPSIYTALIERSSALLPNINKTYSFIPTTMLSNRARLGTIFHAGIEYMLYPTNPRTNTDINDTPIDETSDFISTIKTANNYKPYTKTISVTTNNDNIYTPKILHELFVDNYYVVSENFYKYLNDQSTYADISYMELLIYKFLTGKAIAKEDLAVTIQDYPNWPLLHQLYLLPVAWLLTKSVI